MLLPEGAALLDVHLNQLIVTLDVDEQRWQPPEGDADHATAKASHRHCVHHLHLHIERRAVRVLAPVPCGSAAAILTLQQAELLVVEDDYPIEAGGHPGPLL